ncbi:beta family protein [Pseudogemmobacter bohemicus]|uniref:beta family protein n=1 Tax=Pseudogemmobacter bohemicus TaxID=2250708 RepID=UPI000DD2F166|nr:hypothetical protein [Pseudogemmobacter bohemicus]
MKRFLQVYQDASISVTQAELCKQIIEWKEYSGRGFSFADDRVWRNAEGLTDTCGDATGWRELNTAHHLVRIVRDMGAMSGH